MLKVLCLACVCVFVRVCLCVYVSVGISALHIHANHDATVAPKGPLWNRTEGHSVRTVTALQCRRRPTPRELDKMTTFAFFAAKVTIFKVVLQVTESN